MLVNNVDNLLFPLLYRGWWRLVYKLVNQTLILYLQIFRLNAVDDTFGKHVLFQAEGRTLLFLKSLLYIVLDCLLFALVVLLYDLW